MIKMPNGKFVEHQLTVIRLNKENPREVTFVFPEDTCELSRDDRDNHFHFVYVPTEFIPIFKQDEIR